MKLSQVAYRRFKEGLLTGRIEAGAVMSQADLVRLLDVPISPLREAIQVLESEGLLKVMPRSGVKIMKPDMELIKNSFQLRRILEREAVLKYAASAPTAGVEAWEARHAELLTAVEAGLDQPALGERLEEIDDAFHRALIGSLRNPLIEEVYRLTKERLMLTALDSRDALSPVFVKQTMVEHLKIIAALKTHDLEGAMAAMDEHMTHAMHRAMGL